MSHTCLHINLVSIICLLEKEYHAFASVRLITCSLGFEFDSIPKMEQQKYLKNCQVSYNGTLISEFNMFPDLVHNSNNSYRKSRFLTEMHRNAFNLFQPLQNTQ